MNRDLKRRYIEELRSGKREQCFGKLHCGTKFCAVGLLLDIVDPTGWDPDDGRPHEMAQIDEEVTFDEIDKELGIEGVAEKLFTSNDEGLTFAQVANLVELHVPDDDRPVDVEHLRLVATAVYDKLRDDEEKRREDDEE